MSKPLSVVVLAGCVVVAITWIACFRGSLGYTPVSRLVESGEVRPGQLRAGVAAGSRESLAASGESDNDGDRWRRIVFSLRVNADSTGVASLYGLHPLQVYGARSGEFASDPIVARVNPSSLEVGQSRKITLLYDPLLIEPKDIRIGIALRGFIPTLQHISKRAVIEVALSKGVQLSVRTKDEDGRPVPGCRLVLFGDGFYAAGVWVQSAVTNEAGVAVLPFGVRPGRRRLGVRKTDMVIVDGESLSVGQEPVHVHDCQMGRATSVRGRLILSTGKAIDQVFLVSAGDVRGMSDSDGRFLLASGQNRSGDSVQIAVIGPLYGASRPVATGVWGQDLGDVILPSAGYIRVKVVDSAGSPVLAYGVRLFQRGCSDSTVLRPRYVGRHSNGELRIEGLSSGEFLIQVIPSDLRLFASGIRRVMARPEHDVHLDVCVPSAQSLKLLCVDSMGQPCSGLRLEIVRGEEVLKETRSESLLTGFPWPVQTLGSAVTQKEGRATIRLPVEPGPTHLRVHHAALGCLHCESIHIGVGDAYKIIRLQAYGNLKGNVVGLGRKSSASLALRSADGTIWPQNATGLGGIPIRDGRFAVDHVPVGDYQVSMISPDGKKLGILGSVRINEGQESEVRFECSALWSSLSVTLRVTDPNLRGAVGQVSLVRKEDGDGFTFPRGAVLCRHGEKALVDGVPPGRYKVVFFVKNGDRLESLYSPDWFRVEGHVAIDVDVSTYSLRLVRRNKKIVTAGQSLVVALNETNWKTAVVLDNRGCASLDGVPSGEFAIKDGDGNVLARARSEPLGAVRETLIRGK